MPNLDEVMAKIRVETEKIMAKIIEKFYEKELYNEMGEEEVEVGKERKIKIGEEESSGSDDEDFFSNEAFELMQKTLLKKGFIGERGFKEIIPPFNEVIEKRN